MPSVVITPVGNSTAGNNFTLTCAAKNLLDNLVEMPELQWVGTGTPSSSVNTLDLPFSPLSTSDGGVFICQWTFTTLGISFSNQTSFSLAVNSKHFIILCAIGRLGEIGVNIHATVLELFFC